MWSKVAERLSKLTSRKRAKNLTGKRLISYRVACSPQDAVERVVFGCNKSADQFFVVCDELHHGSRLPIVPQRGVFSVKNRCFVAIYRVISRPRSNHLSRDVGHPNSFICRVSWVSPTGYIQTAFQG